MTNDNVLQIATDRLRNALTQAAAVLVSARVEMHTAGAKHGIAVPGWMAFEYGFAGGLTAYCSKNPTFQLNTSAEVRLMPGRAGWMVDSKLSLPGSTYDVITCTAVLAQHTAMLQQVATAHAILEDAFDPRVSTDVHTAAVNALMAERQAMQDRIVAKFNAAQQLAVQP